MSTTGIPTAHDQRPAGGPGPRPQAASEPRGLGSLRAAPCAHAWPCGGPHGLSHRGRMRG